MAKIFNDPNANPSLLRGLGEGVVTGLKGILEHKVAETQRGKVAQELMRSNVDPDMASYISRQPADIQQKLLANYTPRGQDQMQQGQQQGAYPQHGGGQPTQQGYSPFGGQKQAENAEKMRLQQQKQVDLQSRPYMKSSSGAIGNAQKVLDEALRLKELKATGSVSNGIAGRRPLFLQTSESEQYEKSGNALAQMLAGSQGGVPTGYRIKFALSQKPGLGMQSKTQDELTDRIINEAQAVITKGEIRDMLIEENGMEIPKGLEQLVEKRFKQYGKNPQLYQDDKQESRQRAEENGYGQQQGGEQGEQQPQQEEQPQYNTENESPLGTIARRGISGLARAGEAIVGTPGDITQLGATAANYLTGGAIPANGLLPTSESLKGHVGRLTKGYTNPTSETEKTIDDVVGTVASLFLPSKLKAPLIKNFAKVLNPERAVKAANLIMPYSGTSWKRSLGMGLAGEAGAKGAEALGGGTLTQAGSKLAFMMAAGTKGVKPRLEQTMKNAYKEADEAISGSLTKTNSYPSQGILKQIENTKHKIKGLPAPEQAKILEIVDQVEEGISEAVKNPRIIATHEVLKNSVPIKTLYEQNKALNDWYHLSTAERVSGEKFLSKDGRRYVNDLQQAISEPLNKYAASHPKFGAPKALADDIYRGLAEAAKVKDFFTSSGMSQSITSLIAKKVFQYGANLGIRQTAEVVQFLRHSPEAMKAYKSALLEASKGNEAGALAEITKLNKLGLLYDKLTKK
jgi:hypothetical protein